MGVKVRECKGIYRYLTVGLLIILFHISLAIPTIADQLKDADAAYLRGDYATAFDLLKPLAEQGNPLAQHNLGLMYEEGRGVPQDYAEAMKWYRRVAEQGISQAQFNLGLMYDLGRGVPQDSAEAMKWYRRAAEQGLASAQHNLGVMYERGEGVPQDYVMAHMWYNLAASRYSASEEEKREKALKNRDLVASLMTPAQVAEAQRLAREWKPKKEVR